MEKKKIVRTAITVLLAVALVAVFVISRFYDPTDPHSTVSKQAFIYGPKGHGYTVLNNQQPWVNCYPCHEKKGLGGEQFCVSCHEKSGVSVKIPQPPAK